MRSLVAHGPATLFERHAEVLAERVAVLLSTDVVLLDLANRIIASNNRALVGQTFDSQHPAHPNNDYWVPITLEERVVKVVASQPANGEVLSSRLLKKLVDMVYSQIKVDWYPNPQELKDAFVRQLLHGELADHGDLAQRAAHVGLDMAQPYNVIVIDASPAIFSQADFGSTSEEHVRRRVQAMLTHIANICGPASQVVASYVGGGEIAVLRPCAPAPAKKRGAASKHCASWFEDSLLVLSETIFERMQAQVDPLVRVGVGRSYPGAIGFNRSFVEARTVIELGRRLQRDDAVDSLERLGMAAFVGIADERIKSDVAERCLAPLRADMELYKTISVFFEENCCPSTTAQRLSIHRNTLSYRLDKIADLTGLNPRVFDEAVQLRLALFTRALYPQNG